MNQKPVPAWAHLFEGKDLDEIEAVDPPAGLSGAELLAFGFAQSQAYQMREQANEKAEHEGISAARGKIAALITARAGQTEHSAAETAGARAETVENEPKRTRANPIPFVIPQGKSDELLERQIASCAGIIDHLAHYIARSDTDPQVCANFIDRIASLMNSCAGAGTTIGRLRGLGPEEKVHRMIFQREGGEGVARQ